MRQLFAAGSSFIIFRILLFISILSLIWIPMIMHYHVPDVEITSDMLDKGRAVPGESIFLELNEYNSLDFKINNKTELIRAAESLLKGELPFSSSPKSIIMPFSASDIDKGPPSWKLKFAAFKIPDILIQAYTATGNDKYLITARDVILEWANFEKESFLPRGLLWNDHAIASRIHVLAKFWNLYRKHSIYNVSDASDLFQLVARSAQLLAKPSHFTPATTHGVIQNLALWHLCLCFPTIPDVDSYRELAFDRLQAQFSYLISPEGVILAHSANYHLFGLQHIGKALRYLTLFNIDIPYKFHMLNEKAKEFYAQLRRPDGSLPVYGDTRSFIDAIGPLVTEKDSDGKYKALFHKKDWPIGKNYCLYPVAGYSIWWNMSKFEASNKFSSQTVVLWSYFQGYAHKHADEMSVLMWADGQSWLTNVGYWPYGHPEHRLASSWCGSNAPHFVGEAGNSMRHTKLNFSGWSKKLYFIDIERQAENGYAARRQIVKVNPSIWIVLDSAQGKQRDHSTVTWTFPHDVSLRKGTNIGDYTLISNSNLFMRTFFAVSEESHINHYKGSHSPFAGWQVTAQNGIQPAEALVIEQPANNSWCASIWSFEGKASSNTNIKGFDYPPLFTWKSPEQWKIVLREGDNELKVFRTGNKIETINSVGGHLDELNLNKPVDPASQLKILNNSFLQTTKTYQKFTGSLISSYKITYRIIILFLAQEFFFLFLRKYFRRYHSIFSATVILLWATIALYLTNFRF